MLTAPLCTLAQQGTFTIQGQSAILAKISVDAPRVRGLQSPGKAFLYRYTLEDGQHVDSSIAVDGKFTFTGTVKAPEIGQLLFFDGKSSSVSIVFYLEQGDITVQCPGDGDHAIVTGTPLNKDYQAYKNLLMHSLDSLNGVHTGMGGVDQFSKEAQGIKLQAIRTFIGEHPASPVSLYVLDQYCIGNKQPGIEQQLYDQIDPSLRQSAAGVQLSARIKGMDAGAIGAAAPAVILPDTAGKRVSLSDFKGKYVLIDFWATWCEPCMEEMPNVAKAYHTYKDKDFVVLGISLDRPDSEELWKKVIRRDTLDWPQVSDLKWWNSKAALDYNINGVPANFLVDPSGKIIAKNLRGEALQAKLKELFN